MARELPPAEPYPFVVVERVVVTAMDPIGPGHEQLAFVRRRAAALEQMCAALASEVTALSAAVTELVERPATQPVSVSVDEACRLLGVGRSTMFGLLDSGEIRSVKVGVRRLVPRRAIDEFVESHGLPQAG